MPPSFSILLETENLAAVDGSALDLCLASLAEQHLAPDQANEVLVLDSGEAPPEVLEGLRERYPWVDVVPVGVQCAPVVPFLMIGRTARSVFRSGTYRARFVATAPLVFIGLCLWAYGEAREYASGPA